MIIMAKEKQVVLYLEEIVRIFCLVNFQELKLKVAKITKIQTTLFASDMLGKSWI